MPCPFFTATCFEDVSNLLQTLASRGTPSMQEKDKNASIESYIQDVLSNVQQNGLEAILEYTRRFDSSSYTAKDFCISQQSLEEAYQEIPAYEKTILRQAIDNITIFHEGQKRQSWIQTRPDGTILGQRITPVDRAGLYVPGGQGGTTPLISSLLMNAIPALVAGVPELVVISPPQADNTLNPYILGTAHLLGIKEVYACGSAWGIGALAFGAGPLRPVDMIAGPGNIYVATAKKLLIGTVGIDMLAGPSEILIIADASANPDWIAADMLSQAEHDPLASSICLCLDHALAQAVHTSLQKQCNKLPRRDIAAKALDQYSAIISIPNQDFAFELANTIAPEHLELLLEDPWQALGRIRHAGAIFLGHYAAEPLGDYFAGPNHVLPTMGTARFSSGLGVDSFCKRSSIIAASKTFASQSADAVACLARLEGLEGHARSALCRKTPINKNNG